MFERPHPVGHSGQLLGRRDRGESGETGIRVAGHSLRLEMHPSGRINRIHVVQHHRVDRRDAGASHKYHQGEGMQ